MKVTVTREADGHVLLTASTIHEAEAFIAGMEVHAPELVHAGAYGINADEEADALYQARCARVSAA